jgi:PKD repeat protein
MKSLYKLLLIPLFAILFLPSIVNSQTTYTFTNAGATLRFGPTQSQVNAAYNNTNLSGLVTSNNGIQSFTIQGTGIYELTASGAQGGNGSSTTGGLGATMTGRFNLIGGHVIHIIVGQQGSNGTGGGGGGGSFIVNATTNQVLLVGAGGGGGHNQNGGHGQATNNGTANGGTSASTYGPCGGGYLTDGANSNAGGGGSLQSWGGKAFVNGGEGGAGGNGNAGGGFGGGGGGMGGCGGACGGGGGGGYNGGNSIGDNGYGGGSYNGGTDQINTTGNKTGHGIVVIKVISIGSADIEAISIAPVVNGTSMCQFIEHEFDVTLKNNGPDDASFVDLKVYMEGMDTVELLFFDIRDLLDGETKTYRISTPRLEPTKVGNYTLYLEITKVFNDNDDPANNIASSNEVVVPTPFDSELIPVLPYDGRLDLGIFNYPDMTNARKEIEYEIKAPTGFTNGGNNWTVENISTSLSGNPLPSSFFTLTQHSSGNNASLKVTFPDSYEDSNVILAVKLKSNDDCEKVFTRHVYIAATVRPNFIFSQACAGESLLFTNLSTLAKGVPKYIWYFGDGSDSLETFADPEHTYVTSGTFDVTLVGITDLGFRTDTTMTISVTPTPTADFTFKNACMGEPIELEENASISFATALDYTWTLGDGNTSNQPDVTHAYATHGAYNVSLYVESIDGCKSTITKQVQQHPLPVADFNLPTTPQCFSTPIYFSNQSTIPYTNVGYDWKLEDGTKYSMLNASHQFSNAGSTDIKLVATSEFGCKDSIIKGLLLLPTPIVDFEVYETCLNGNALLMSTSDVTGGQNIAYTWKTGDGMLLNGNQTQHTYSVLGNYQVELEVTFDNSCSNKLSKQITVNERPTANFEVNESCDGEYTSFANTSSIVNGQLIHYWTFGDGNSSTDYNPQHLYASTGNYEVVLITNSGTSCTDTFKMMHSVNEMPVCDFDWEIDWSLGYEEGKRHIKFIPANTTYDNYTWYFANFSSSSQTSPSYKFSIDGTYNVRLVAKTAEGCECQSTQTVIAKSTGLPFVETREIKFYPNPSTDYLNVENLTANNKTLNYLILDQTGRSLQTGSLNQGVNRIDLCSLANGTYYIRMTMDGVSGTYPFVVVK